jgi:polysaccharide chain length determinant protein (PEP-CTERM system associated)
MQELAYQFASRLRAAWRHRWFALAAAWIIAICGWALVHRMPDRYEATVRVWVDTQSVLKPLLAGVTVQPNVQQLLAMLSRTLMSRPNLEKVIRMAGMESGIKTPEGKELLVARLTKEVSVLSAGGDNLFTIAYTDRDPQTAELVVRSLLTIFVEGSRSDQRRDSETAQRFIDEEIKTYKEKLDAAENAMIEFKRRQVLAAGARGDQTTQLVSVQAALDDAKIELKIAEAEWETIKRRSADQAEIPDLLREQRADGRVPSEIDTRVKALEQKLDALRFNYTDQHPDVVALMRTIAQLEEQKKTEASQRKPSASAAPAPEPLRQPLTATLTAAEANLAAAKFRVAEYTKRLDELKAAAAAAPEADAEYAHLSRDYEMAKSTYASMLSRRETARISDKMESASVTNFRVVDPPQVSSRPKSPDRPRLNLLVLVVALAGGAALAYLLSQLTPTISDERRLREVSGAQVLATVLKNWTDAEKRQRIRSQIAFLMSFVGLLSAYAAITFAVALVSGA